MQRQICQTCNNNHHNKKDVKKPGMFANIYSETQTQNKNNHLSNVLL